MSNIIKKTTDLAMHIVHGYTIAGGVIVDATCGNGHDTLSLAKTSPSRLYAFDIQHQATESTRSLLIREGFEEKLYDSTISIICDSHRFMTKYIDEPVNVVVFNLGYLPGGDKSQTTKAQETVDAVSSALSILAKDGLVCITMYSGHDEGLREKELLLSFASDLDPHIYHVAYVDFINQKKQSPDILLITKK